MEKLVPEDTAGNVEVEMEDLVPEELQNLQRNDENNTEDTTGLYNRLIEQLKQFRASSNQEYVFDEDLGVDVRAALHVASRKMGMNTKCRGKRRRLTVYKGDHKISKIGKGVVTEREKKKSETGKGEMEKKKSKTGKGVLTKREKKKSETGKDVFASLKLSEQSKEVLLDLFMQHPPGQDGIEQLKLVDSSKMKRKLWNKGDDIFCKPLMNRGDIANKVEAFSLRIKNDQNLAKINEQRTRLPIASSQDIILSKIESNQVVLISGETGCGKTTQVPQFLLDKMWESGETCKIICTQPRQISATSVALRISEERGEVVGETVGYKIRLESKGGRGSSIVFCTNGVLLRVLVSDGLARSDPDSSRAVASNTLSQITHIVVDEIHERDHYSDFMLAILRDILPRYPHLRVVLMSATMDVEKFSQYFGGCPIISVPGFTYPVKTFYLEDILSILQSVEKNHIDVTSPSSSTEHRRLTDEHKVALDDAIDLAWSNDEFDALLELISSIGTAAVSNYQHSQTGVSPLMVFAAKGRVGDVCMLLSFRADCLLKAQEGSTALDWARRAEQIKAADVISQHLINVSSYSKVTQALVYKYASSINPQYVDILLIEKLLEKICMDSESGAILVFLPGWEDINKTRDRLLAHEYFKDNSKFLILPLHSMVASAEQKKVFDIPRHGCRKIVLSTNIAETAVTIDDVVYVIDTGMSKIKSYDPYRNISSLQSSWISKASVKQRVGRAGRCQPGFCYHLYAKLRADSFPSFQTPAIKRMPIEELCLQVKMLDPNYNITEFLNKTLDPPVNETIRNAVTVLKEVGALSNIENITELGKRLGSLPVHPLSSKMLFLAILFDCLEPALTLACASDCQDPFILPILPEEKEKAADAKAELAAIYGGHSDQLAVVAAFECWKNASQEKGLQAKFCSEYFISHNIMTTLSMLRKQLRRELKQNGYIPDDIPRCSQNARDPGIIHSVLVAGLYPNIGKVLPHFKVFCIETASGAKVRFNQQSTHSLLPLMQSEDKVVVYGEITKEDWDLQVKKYTIIGNLLLVLLAGEIAVAPMKDNSDSDVKKRKKGEVMSSAGDLVVMTVDHWLSLKSTALEAAQIYCLRERLSTALLLKATSPREVLPPALTDSVNAIACILSYDGQSRISLISNSADTPTVSDSKTGNSSKENYNMDLADAQGTHSLEQSVPSLPSFPAESSVSQVTDHHKSRKKKSKPSQPPAQPDQCLPASTPSILSVQQPSLPAESSVSQVTDHHKTRKKKSKLLQPPVQPKQSCSVSTGPVPVSLGGCETAAYGPKDQYVSASIPSSLPIQQSSLSAEPSVSQLTDHHKTKTRKKKSSQPMQQPCSVSAEPDPVSLARYEIASYGPKDQSASASIPSNIPIQHSSLPAEPSVSQLTDHHKTKTRKKKSSQPMQTWPDPVDSAAYGPKDQCVSASIPLSLPIQHSSLPAEPSVSQVTDHDKTKTRKKKSGLAIQQSSLPTTDSSVSQVTDHHKTREKKRVPSQSPALPNQCLRASTPSGLPMQQPCSVSTRPVPVSLVGCGSADYGPLGPRGRLSKKRSRSDR